MHIRAVIFDFGGVIVRTDDRAPRERLAARLGMTHDQLSSLVFDSQSALQAALGKITTQEHWETLRNELGVFPDDLANLPLDFWGGDVLDQELVDYIRALRPDYKTGLISNAWDDLRQVLENTWKIADVFDEIIISAEVGVAKPDPGIYQTALERLAVTPQQAVFVDDFPANIEGARAVGMHAIHFKNSLQARQELDNMLNSKDN
jgi:epoxide hydrolase-like predicted phosphatase